MFLAIRNSKPYGFLYKRFSSLDTSVIYIFFIGLALFAENIMHFDINWSSKPANSFVLVLTGLSLFTFLFQEGRFVFALFFFSCVYLTIESGLRYEANHVLLCFWLLAPLLYSPQFAKSDIYADYVGRTVGLVMVAAATQKLISGNYLNGAYIKYLAYDNVDTEQFFNLACFGTDPLQCDALVYLSIFAVVIQYAIGFLLLFGCRHILALLAEVAFVLGVGFMTNEMNFQTINIAALLLAFRVSATWPILLSMAGLLVIDYISLNWIMGELLR